VNYEENKKRVKCFAFYAPFGRVLGLVEVALVFRWSSNAQLLMSIWLDRLLFMPCVQSTWQP